MPLLSASIALLHQYIPPCHYYIAAFLFVVLPLLHQALTSVINVVWHSASHCIARWRQGMPDAVAQLL